MSKIDCSGGVGLAWRFLFRSPSPWSGCCLAHDKAYKVGGGASARYLADLQLYKCVRTNGWPKTASVFFYAVRWFGWPFFNWRD